MPRSTTQPSVQGKGKRPAAAAGADGSVGKRPASAAATAAAAAPAAAAGAGSGAGGSTGAAKKCKASKPGSEHGKNKLTIAQRLQIVEAVKAGKQRSKVAEEYGITKPYITKLMKPDKIAELHKSRDMELNLDALRAPTPVHTGLETRLLKWIKIARARFEVRASFLCPLLAVPVYNTLAGMFCG